MEQELATYRVSYLWEDICPLNDCVLHTDIRAYSEDEARRRFRRDYPREEITNVRKLDGPDKATEAGP